MSVWKKSPLLYSLFPLILIGTFLPVHFCSMTPFTSMESVKQAFPTDAHQLITHVSFCVSEAWWGAGGIKDICREKTLGEEIHTHTQKGTHTCHNLRNSFSHPYEECLIHTHTNSLAKYYLRGATAIDVWLRRTGRSRITQVNNKSLSRCDLTFETVTTFPLFAFMLRVNCINMFS